MYPKREKDGTLIFPDYPDFRPNLTPREMFQGGAMDGTYWRPLKSLLTGKELKNWHKKYSFLKDLPDDIMSRTLDKKDPKINKYGVHASLPYEEWVKNHWIKLPDEFGWINYYCEFYAGRRIKEIDEYQIKRWKGIADAKSGRFRKNLIRQIYDSGKKFDDITVSPRIRQTLYHWGYELTENDYKEGVKELLEKRKKESKKNIIKKPSKKSSKKPTKRSINRANSSKRSKKPPKK
jgi:hypothetical protein